MRGKRGGAVPGSNTKQYGDKGTENRWLEQLFWDIAVKTGGGLEQDKPFFKR